MGAVTRFQADTMMCLNVLTASAAENTRSQLQGDRRNRRRKGRTKTKKKKAVLFWYDRMLRQDIFSELLGESLEDAAVRLRLSTSPCSLSCTGIGYGHARRLCYSWTDQFCSRCRVVNFQATPFRFVIRVVFQSAATHKESEKPWHHVSENDEDFS